MPARPPAALVFAAMLVAASPARAQTSPAASERGATAIRLLSAGRAAEAERLLVQEVAARPRDGAAWNALGLARHAQERWPEAVAAFERAVELLAGQPQARANLGAALLEDGQLTRARRELEAAASLDPAYAKARLLLGRTAVAAGDAAGAEAAFRETTRLAPDEPIGWYQLALLQLQQRRHADAIVALRRSLELAPDLPSAHLNLGLALRRAGDAGAAASHLARFQALSEAIASDAREQARLASALMSARDALAAGRPDAALLHAAAAARLAPRAPAPHALLAEALLRLGRPAEAESERRRAAALQAEAAAP